jgi:hypothetical protein
MDKTHHRQVPLLVTVAFCLGLCNLVLREFVVILDSSIDRCDPQQLAEHGGIPDPAHIHDHDDDFVSAALFSPNIRIVLARERGNADLPAWSQTLAPLLPPPKAA